MIRPLSLCTGLHTFRCLVGQNRFKKISFTDNQLHSLFPINPTREIPFTLPTLKSSGRNAKGDCGFCICPKNVFDLFD